MVHPNTDGLIYYALDATRWIQRVKIGTTTNLEQRMKQLWHQAASRQAPILLAVEQGGVTRESELHQRFQHLRRSGEWFSYRDELAEYIAELQNPFALLADHEDLWHYAAGWNGLPQTTTTGMAKDGIRAPETALLSVEF